MLEEIEKFVELTERCLRENQSIRDRFTRPPTQEDLEQEARASAADRMAKLLNNQRGKTGDITALCR